VSDQPITLDMNTATPINSADPSTPANSSGVSGSGVTLDMSTAQPIDPPSNGVGQFVKGVWEQTGAPLLHAVAHPIDTVADAIPNAISSEKRMLAHADDVNNDPHSTVAQHIDAGLYALPVVGETLKNMDDMNRQGKHAEAYGQASGLLASLFGPEALKAASGPAMSKLAAQTAEVSPRVSKLVNNSIGLKASDLSDWDRTHVGNVHDIGATVYNEAGFKSSLPAQKAAVEDALQRNVAGTQKIVGDASTPGNVYNPDHTLLDMGEAVKDKFAETGSHTPEQIQSAVDAVKKALSPQLSRDMTPAELVEARNSMAKGITDWDPNTQNIGQRYRQMVYHDLNQKLETRLSPADADAFRANNRIVNQLLTAKNAIGRTEVNNALKPSTSPLKTAAGIATKTAAGAVFGAHGAVAAGAYGLGEAATRALTSGPAAARAEAAIRMSGPNIIRQAARGGVATPPIAAQVGRAAELVNPGGDSE
jgi:hypothetical protein